MVIKLFRFWTAALSFFLRSHCTSARVLFYRIPKKKFIQCIQGFTPTLKIQTTPVSESCRWMADIVSFPAPNINQGEHGQWRDTNYPVWKGSSYSHSSFNLHMSIILNWTRVGTRFEGNVGREEMLHKQPFVTALGNGTAKLWQTVWPLT